MSVCILFFGDIVGKPGREAVKKVLPGLVDEHHPDFIIANVENITHGAGVTREKVEEMLEVGIDAFTTGDHVFDVQSVEELLHDPAMPIVRPLNWPGNVPGRGWRIVEKGERRLLLMNVLGRVFMKIQANDYFEAVKRALKEASKDDCDVSFLDMHAEATSEKRALAETFDGEINLVVGTHTHVQTNDAQTLHKGTGFLTDVGMCGPQHSVLGVDTQAIITRLRTQIRPARHEPAEGPCEVGACVARVERGKTIMKVVRLRDEVC